MKKLMAISLIASSVLFAGPIELGVVQSNTVLGITTATNGSAVKQGSVEVYGDSTVYNDSPLNALPNVASINAIGGIFSADGNSTIEQGTLQISDSKVHIRKVEANGMAGGAIAKNNSEISQGKWKIVDVHGRSSIKNGILPQVNAMAALALAKDNSKITQGSIEVGSVDDVTIRTTGLNTLAGPAILAKNGSSVNQGSITICGNTHLAKCGN